MTFVITRVICLELMMCLLLYPITQPAPLASLMSSALVAILFSHQFKWFCTAEGLQHRLANIVIVTIGVHKSVQFGLNLQDSTALARYRCRYS